jgi:heme a synthase
VGVVLWGAVVRATGSGAGCGRHWPRCNGQMLPELASAKTLIEFSHRATSGVAFLLVLGVLVWALRGLPRRHPARLGALLSMGFMVAEALAGAGLVLFEWVADDRSAGRAASLAVHLVITFLLLGSLALTAWWASGNAAVRLRARGQPVWMAAGAAGLLLLIGITGAMTALGDTLFPKSAIGLELGASAHFLERLRVVHPLLAIGAGALAVALLSVVARRSGAPRARRLATGLAVVYGLQLLAGALNLILLVPLWMQLIHLGMADALWITAVLTAAASFGEQDVGGRGAGQPLVEQPAVA